MAQLNLPTLGPPNLNWLEGLEQEEVDPDGARYYQRQAYNAIMAKFATHRSLFAMMATGTGKTHLASMFAKNWTEGHVLFLAARDELITQAKEKLESMLHFEVEVEKAAWTSSPRCRVVVGSNQSVCQKARLERLGTDRFGLIIQDEAAHALAPTFRRVYDHMTGAKLLGLSATTRGDGKALRKVFEEVGYVFDILKGIDHGWLVPVRGRSVKVEGLDISRVKTAVNELGDKDLERAGLDDAMLAVGKAIALKTTELEPDRQAIIYMPGIRSAEYVCGALNDIKTDSAIFICGKTDPELRRALMRAFKRGEHQYLVNVEIATEGVDVPPVSCIVMGRMTKSLALATQMAGRGTRPHGAGVDLWPNEDQADDRRQSIAKSQKPDCVILDFVGNFGKHKGIVTPEDILGGDFTPKERALAKKMRAEGARDDSLTLLRKAKLDLVKLARSVILKSLSATVSDFDPFDTLGMDISDEMRKGSYYGRRLASDGQLNAMRHIGVPSVELEGMSYLGASRFLREINRRRKADLASYGQMARLRQWGVSDQSLSFGRAHDALDYLHECGWDKSRVDPNRLADLVLRQPGDEG